MQSLRFTSVWSHPLRRYGPLTLFALASFLLILAGVLGNAPTPRQELILLQDISDSVTINGPQPLPESLKQLAESAGTVHWVQFAVRPAVVPTEDSLLSTASFTPPVDRSGSDYASALRLALALPRNGVTRRRVVLLGDGRVTGDIPRDLIRSETANAVLDVVPVGTVSPMDARIVRFYAAPATVSPSASVGISLHMEASSPTRGRLMIRDETGLTLLDEDFDLTPAGLSVDRAIALTGSGFRRLRAELTISGDRIPENNRADCAVLVQPPRRILWIGASPPPSLEGLEVTAVSPGNLSKESIRSSAGCVLDNVPASAMSRAALDELHRAVRDGMALLVLGGSDSLAVGGYDQPVHGSKPLGEMLPVRVVPRDQLAVAIALDTSGSMAGEINTPEGPATKLSYGASAVLETWNRLSAGDDMAVVTFSEKALLKMPAQSAGDNKPAITARMREFLERLAPGGGTSVFAGAFEALGAIESIRAHTRLVILITDGDTREDEAERQKQIERLEAEVKQSGIALAVIAVGDDPDIDFLNLLQDNLGADIIRPTYILELPSLLWRQVEKNRDIRRGATSVALVIQHPLTQSLSQESVPPIRSFMAVGAIKESGGGQALLETVNGEALLSAWQYGLGRVVVLAGDPQADWKWSADQARALLGDAVRWGMEYAPRNEVECRLEEARLTIRYREPAPVSATVQTARRVQIHDLDGEAFSTSILLLSEGPSAWSGSITLPPPGMYRIQVTSPDTEARLAQTACLVENRAEWLRFGPDGRALAEMALAGGGRVVYDETGFTPWEAIPARGSAPDTPASTWLLGVGIALGLIALVWSAWR